MVAVFVPVAGEAPEGAAEDPAEAESGRPLSGGAFDPQAIPALAANIAAAIKLVSNRDCVSCSNFILSLPLF
jgi:hypothetical protein